MKKQRIWVSRGHARQIGTALAVALSLSAGWQASQAAAPPAVVKEERGGLPSLAPMLKPVLPSVVNISSRGRVKVEKSAYAKSVFQ